MVVQRKNLNLNSNQQHPFHLVDPSPWPVVVALNLQVIVCLSLVAFTGGVIENYGYSWVICPSYNNNTYYLVLFFLFLIANIAAWVTDIMEEGIFLGEHTEKVSSGLCWGIALFIVSEVMFFFSLFWAFFHFSLSPSIWIGGVWPPKGINPVNPWGYPLANTILLLTSGCSITFAHTSILKGDRPTFIWSMLLTLFFALLFLLLQGFEFYNSSFSISCSVYGSVFYMIAGFHGFHVIVGTVMLGICFLRSCSSNISIYRKNHIGFLCAIWYWHFVDVVRLFVWIFLYVWGSA